MKRGPILWVLVGLPLVVMLSWIGSNTEWQDVKVPMPPTGEALTNPFYVVQRFADTLGARTSWDRIFTTPSPNAVLVLSNWHWSLGESRRDALQRWVAAGGRLVVDSSLIGDHEDFDEWSGISEDYPDEDEDENENENEKESGHDGVKPLMCRTFVEEGDVFQSTAAPDKSSGTPSTAAATTPSTTVSGTIAGTPAVSYSLCHIGRDSFLTTSKHTTWAVSDKTGVQAVRVPIGRGSVTVINGTPFKQRELFHDDHGRLFVAATQLRRGDEVHFLSEVEHPSLLALVWHHGAPVVVLSFALIALLLWRGAVRFGPLAAPSPVARRSLAEQIRGTGQFAIRHGSGAALHTASVRALEEAAQRRINGYSRLSEKQRAEALARVVGIDRKALWTAMHEAEADIRGPQDLRRTLALLERARRRTVTVTDQKRSSHGTGSH